LIDNNQLDIPEILNEFFFQDEDFSTNFNQLSIGKKRNICFEIEKKKSVNSKIEYILKIAQEIQGI
jgi:uncharacterized protein YdeI (YjbR/CyaY-like superfamily)